MPSLDEWEKYLKEQEEALLKSLQHEDESENTESKDIKSNKTNDIIPKNDSLLFRNNLPKHILSKNDEQEVAQNSYAKFKETREEMFQRLLDPLVTLEDTARILNVCPTTVRRYTNKGVLPHVRTVGNQRRFRLSDILAFLEKNSASGADKNIK